MNLGKIIDIPSHHRAHNATNPENIDRNDHLRPENMKEKYPIAKLDDVYDLGNHASKHHRLAPARSWIQLEWGLLFVYFLFVDSGSIGIPGVYLSSGYSPIARYFIVGYFIISTVVVALFWWDHGRRGPGDLPLPTVRPRRGHEL